MVALCDIAEGTEITICYIHPKVTLSTCSFLLVHFTDSVSGRVRPKREGCSCGRTGSSGACALRAQTRLTMKRISSPKFFDWWIVGFCLTHSVLGRNSDRYSRKYLCPCAGCGGSKYAADPRWIS
jgi:hypothetical protein